ncbi:hypothetical protein NPIL_54081 [Nephila pilipes]|uniref:Uncharacterized protein n=1 Tax=Nephila pilipes TaxID=299642 RepID=A0A8X6NW68_NEPPI|nr:hypothetical protein NPIL_54081 [Nephila pilipes]
MLLCGSTLLRPLRLGHLTGKQILFRNCSTFSEHVVRCIHSTILDASLQQHSNNMVPPLTLHMKFNIYCYIILLRFALYVMRFLQDVFYVHLIPNVFWFWNKFKDQVYGQNI